MQAASTTLILGGGVGGIVTARSLRALLPAPHRIVLIERTAGFHLGTTKTWVALDLRRPEEVVRGRDALARHGIELQEGEILSIDLERRKVRTNLGEASADYLVVALGAQPSWDAVPGLEAAAETFYTLEGAIRLREALRSFAGGEVVLLIPRLPFPCPPGPYEGAMLLRERLESGPGKGRARLSVQTIETSPMTTAGPAMGEWVKAALAERGIAFHPGRKAVRVEPARRAICFEDGSETGYDLLITIPPFSGSPVVRASGLGNEAGWIPVEPTSLRILGAREPDRSFAIGDATAVALPGRHQPGAPLSLPKAGAFAEAGARVVASRIAAHVHGREPQDLFDGRGTCYIEMGGGIAARGDGYFFEMPSPQMSHQEASGALLEEKRGWVADWMETYLR